jgi:hypothetical protein
MVRDMPQFWYNISKALLPVTFGQGSQGQVAMVIYEWTDAPYLGKADPGQDDDIRVPVR